MPASDRPVRISDEADPEEQARGDATEAGQAPELDQLRAEVTDLRQAMETYPVIDQARGMVMALEPCTAVEAWQVLIEVSQHSNAKLREIAAQIVATTEGRDLPTPLHQSLTEAPRRHRPNPG